jgi:hypothetical protein
MPILKKWKWIKLLWAYIPISLRQMGPLIEWRLESWAHKSLGRRRISLRRRRAPAPLVQGILPLRVSREWFFLRKKGRQWRFLIFLLFLCRVFVKLSPFNFNRQKSSIFGRVFEGLKLVKIGYLWVGFFLGFRQVVQKAAILWILAIFAVFWVGFFLSWKPNSAKSRVFEPLLGWGPPKNPPKNGVGSQKRGRELKIGAPPQKGGPP